MNKILGFLMILTVLFLACTKDDANLNFDSRASDGKSGSTASMITYGNYIYMLDNTTLIVLDASNNTQPKEVRRVDVGEGVETLFAYGTHLYMGTRRGLLIYSIVQRDFPKYIGTNQHFFAKDPVVVNGTIAYVTIRNGEERVNPSGSLQIVNVSNPVTAVTQDEIFQPYPCGLAYSGDVLYVCNGIFGINIFSIENPISPEFIKNYYHLPVYDCIPDGNLLICQSENGLVLYDISVPTDPVFLKAITN